MSLDLAMQVMRRGHGAVMVCGEYGGMKEPAYEIHAYPAGLAKHEKLGEGIRRVCKRVMQSRPEMDIGLAVACELLNKLGMEARLHQVSISQHEALPGQHRARPHDRATRSKIQARHLVSTALGWFDGTGRHFSSMEIAWPMKQRRTRAEPVCAAQHDRLVARFMGTHAWILQRGHLMQQLEEDLHLAVLEATTEDASGDARSRRL